MTTTDTRCMLGLGHYLGGSTMTFGEAARILLDHAAGLIEDGGATDPRAAADLAVAREVLARPAERSIDTQGPLVLVPATVAETASLYRAVAVGCEYAATNGYADDEDYPDDAEAARTLPTPAALVLCYAGHGPDGNLLNQCVTPDMLAPTTQETTS
ncbi:MAG: hypothetical protein ACTHKG_06255 [Nocardioides sp.]